jgi:hypothetical protein
MNPKFWDERYSQHEFVYGPEPNVFFREQLELLEPSTLLLPGEGDGRNAAFACSTGWQVTAYDWSQTARDKTVSYLNQRRFSINYQVADILTLDSFGKQYSAAASIFFHIPSADRTAFFQKLSSAILPGGTFIFLAYSKEQLGKKSGGPQDIDLLYSLDEIVESFIDYDFSVLSLETINHTEGNFHRGEASVIKFVGHKPADE